MATISRFKVVKNYFDWELWEGSIFLKRFMNVEDMLEYVYDLRRYLPEEVSQLPLEWD